MSLGANETCSVYSMQDFNGLGIATNINVGMVPRDNNTIAAMSICCAPNSVNLVNNCVLWCELPTAMVNKSKNAGSSLAADFNTCLQANHAEPDGGISAVHEAAGARNRKGPSLLSVGMLTIVLGWMCVFT